MTTTAITADAINRLDDGIASPVDREAAEQHDRRLQWVQPAPYLCVICDKPCWGSECVSCHNRYEAWLERATDV